MNRLEGVGCKVWDLGFRDWGRFVNCNKLPDPHIYIYIYERRTKSLMWRRSHQI